MILESLKKCPELGHFPLSNLAVARMVQEEDKTELENFVKELNSRNESKVKCRQKNLESANNRPDEQFFRKLDSNLKKTNAFVKKLKTLTESQRTALIKDFGGLNLSKYVAEMASSLVEVKLKMSDVGTAVEICSLAHQRYSEFSGQLLEQLKRVLPRKKDEKPSNPSKFRVDLRILAELISVGVIGEKEGLPILGGVLTNLINTDKESHQNLPTVIAFCKYCGQDYAGLVPRKFRLLSEKFSEEIPKSHIFSSDRQKNVFNLLKEYYQTLSSRVMDDWKEVRRLERRNKRQYLTKGEISPENKLQRETAKVALDKLSQSAIILADLLDQECPPIPDKDPMDDDELNEESGMIIQVCYIVDASCVALGGYDFL